MQPSAIAIGTEAEFERRTAVAVSGRDGPAIDCPAGVADRNLGPDRVVEWRAAVGGVACAPVRPRAEHGSQDTPVTEAEVPAHARPPRTTSGPPRDHSGREIRPSRGEGGGPSFLLEPATQTDAPGLTARAGGAAQLVDGGGGGGHSGEQTTKPIIGAVLNRGARGVAEASLWFVQNNSMHVANCSNPGGS